MSALGILDAHLQWLNSLPVPTRGALHQMKQVNEARAAVAKLILAGSEYVRLETEYWSDDASLNELRWQYEDAKARFEDALARAAGGKS